ncbi:MAG: heavy-metal-associated domain-containing protein [Acidimicrobiales bacterium]
MSTRTTHTVVGMTCDHCAGTVRNEVAGITGVTRVDVDLATGEVVVESAEPIDDAVFTEAVREAGYEVAS